VLLLEHLLDQPVYLVLVWWVLWIEYLDWKSWRYYLVVVVVMAALVRLPNVAVGLAEFCKHTRFAVAVAVEHNHFPRDVMMSYLYIVVDNRMMVVVVVAAEEAVVMNEYSMNNRLVSEYLHFHVDYCYCCETFHLACCCSGAVCHYSLRSQRRVEALEGSWTMAELGPAPPESRDRPVRTLLDP
jgi:hypothetical protein